MKYNLDQIVPEGKGRRLQPGPDRPVSCTDNQLSVASSERTMFILLSQSTRLISLQIHRPPPSLTSTVIAPRGQDRKTINAMRMSSRKWPKFSPSRNTNKPPWNSNPSQTANARVFLFRNNVASANSKPIAQAHLSIHAPCQNHSWPGPRYGRNYFRYGYPKGR